MIELKTSAKKLESNLIIEENSSSRVEINNQLDVIREQLKDLQIKKFKYIDKKDQFLYGSGGSR